MRTYFVRGIPNLALVDRGRNIWRGGQPFDGDDAGERESWLFIRGLGVDTVVKLNTGVEGSDATAEQIGMRVVRTTDLWEATTVMHRGNVFVHCTHGRDRTGSAVAAYRVRFQNWDAGKARKEALELGQNIELLGLDSFVEACKKEKTHGAR